MRVAIDAAVLGSGRGGDETYLRGLLTGLSLAADPVRDRFGIFTRRGAPLPADIAAHPSFTEHPVAAPGRAARYLFALPLAVARAPGRHELLLSINHAPVVSSVPRALVIHDLSYLRHPEFYPRRTLMRLRWLVPLHVRQSRVIVTGSEFSRRDLIEAYRLEPGRVQVIPPAIVLPAAAPEPVAETGAPYFLYLGNLHPRKNLAGLVRAFARARASGLGREQQLVIAGAAWWRDTTIASDLRDLPEDAVRVVGRVSDEERDRLLRGATALVYPSLFEGIGLPPLEAMALGTPVIASNTAALPETCGDGALLVDPRDPDALASALIAVASDAGLRTRLGARGLERAAAFSPRRTGEIALAVFRGALGGTDTRALPFRGAGEMKGR